MEIRRVYIVSDCALIDPFGLALGGETPRWCMTYKNVAIFDNFQVEYYNLNNCLVQYNLYIWIQQLF